MLEPSFGFQETYPGIPYWSKILNTSFWALVNPPLIALSASAGACPALLIRCLFAPSDRSVSTDSGSPLRAARCNAVSPL